MVIRWKLQLHHQQELCFLEYTLVYAEPAIAFAIYNHIHVSAGSRLGQFVYVNSANLRLSGLSEEGCSR
jgi:hypothetical protein